MTTRSRSERDIEHPAVKAAGIFHVRVGSPLRASLSGHKCRSPIRFRRKDRARPHSHHFGCGHAAAPHLDGIATIRMKAGLRQRATRGFSLRSAGTTPLFKADPGFNPGLVGSTLIGSATRSVRSARLRLSDDPGRDRNTSGACRAGMVPASRQELRKCPSPTPTPSPSASPPP